LRPDSGVKLRKPDMIFTLLETGEPSRHPWQA